MLSASEYLNKLTERRGTSRVYTKHQAMGVRIAELLEDTEHTGLYIKLVRDLPRVPLLGYATDIASRRAVKNKGAYFMRVLAAEGLLKAPLPRSPRKRSRTTT